MKEETISLTRQELYEQVWSEPIVHLSKFYNLSDVGLSKICKKMNIPVPGRGYWEKKHHGHDPEEHPCRCSRGPEMARYASQSVRKMTILTMNSKIELFSKVFPKIMSASRNHR